MQRYALSTFVVWATLAGSGWAQDTQPTPTPSAALHFEIKGFVVRGNSLLPDAQVQAAVAPFVGAQRSLSDVQSAADALRRLYSAQGYTVVQVIPPQQTLQDGVVQLQVVEDKVVTINVTGNSQYDSDNIRASLPALRQGASLNAHAVEAAILLANENSAKQVALNVQPGQRPGEIATTIQVSEDRISKWSATYDNTGAANTGVNKIGLVYQNANLFNRDHALTLQYNGTTENIDKVYSLSAGYHLPLYARGLSLDLMAAYSSSSGQNVNLYFSGKGTVLGARLNQALPSWGPLHHKLSYGLDYKDSQSVSGPLSTPITETPLSLSWAAQWANPSWQGSLSLSHLHNLPGGPHGAQSDYYDATSGLGARIPLAGPGSLNQPTPQWTLWRLNANAATALGADWQLRANLSAQQSSHLLLPSEQFGVGGASSVRGYPERIAAGDSGHSLNLELYSPELAKTLNLPNASLRALLFWDLGRASLNDSPLPAGLSDSVAVEGLGLGLRLTLGKNLSAKWDMGWAQKAAGAAPTQVRSGDTTSAVALAYSF